MAAAKRHPSTLAVGVAALGLAIAGCGGSGTDRAEPPGDPGPVESVGLQPTKSIRCQGARPDYYVPGADHGRIAVIRCLRLGASGGTVEFSVNPEGIGGDRHVCINPAYPARGASAGDYIPGVCQLVPVGQRLEILNLQPPTQSDVQPHQLHRLAYRDLDGRIHFPIDAAVDLARSFAAADPDTVLRYIGDREDEWIRGGYQPGNRYLHDLHREFLPGFALARQWAGFEQEKEARRKEISRLRSLLASAASDLTTAGKDRQAARLRRAADGR